MPKHDDAAQSRPTFEADGSVNVPAFRLPPSEFLSAEARAQQEMRALYPITQTLDLGLDIAERRAQLDAMMAPRVALMQQLYPADVAEHEIGGVPVRIVTPRGVAVDPARVLINLHGGAFCVGWGSCSLIEALPIAALGGFTVISVNYRMAPEHAHPAGVEDVAAVFAALLADHAPGRIGIFGGSAGGALTAHAAAWFPAHGLPQPGAIGIFGAGGTRFEAGDSAYFAGYADGSFPPPLANGRPQFDMTRGYFAGVDPNGPMVAPALHAEVIAKFPPTLIITGTRAMDLSPAVVTNSALLRSGVRSTLIVGEGMGHCYHYSPQLPEAQDAYAAIIAHFREYLR